MSHRKPRQLAFANQKNIHDLINYLLYSQSNIFARLAQIGGFCKENSLHARLSLINKLKDEDLAEDGEQSKVNALNSWQQEYLNRNGHMLVNNAFSKWNSAQKSNGKKITITGQTHQQLNELKQFLGYDSLDEVLQHYLPEPAQMNSIREKLVEK